MKRVVIAVVVALSFACGDDVPTRPTPLPSANLQMDGTPQWVACVIGLCVFRAELRNMGQGCGTSVRGVTRFYDGGGAALGAAYNWSVNNDQIIRPNEVFTYQISGVPQSIAAATQRYLTEPAWTDVRCP